MFQTFCFVPPTLFVLLLSADVMVGMGYNLEEIQDSLAKMKYDEITATYLLLGRKASEVRAVTVCGLVWFGGGQWGGGSFSGKASSSLKGGFLSL